MIKVRSQSDFDTMVANPSNTEMIAIYALPNGESYKLSRKMVLKGDTYIKGVNMPIIEWSSNISGASDRMIECIGANTTITGVLQNIVIDGLHLRGVEGVYSDGIYLENCGFCIYSSLSSSYTTSHRGADKNSAIGATIRNVRFENIKGTALEMLRCGYSTIINNIFENNWYTGYFNIIQNSIFSKNKSMTSGMLRFEAVNTNVISYNDIVNTNNGLYFDNSHSNAIRGNNIANCDYGALSLYDCTDNSVTDNTISNNELGGTQAGVDMYNSWGHSIHGNSILNGSGHGISLKDNSNRNAITGNTCMYNSGTGILNTGSTYNTFYGNISSNNGTNISVTGTGVLNNINMTTNHTG